MMNTRLLVGLGACAAVALNKANGELRQLIKRSIASGVAKPAK